MSTSHFLEFTIPKNSTIEPFITDFSRRAGALWTISVRPPTAMNNRSVFNPRQVDVGSASLEFIIVTLGVFVPIVALTVSVAAIQRAQFAVTEIARHGARAVSRVTSDAAGHNAVAHIAALTLADFGIDSSPAITVTCTATPCRSYGGLVNVGVSLRVPIVMVPGLPGLERFASVPVSATVTRRAALPG